ncbi:MAG: hypothetical protein RIG62_28650, partial [Cyclobacteriaceae bacterium]
MNYDTSLRNQFSYAQQTTEDIFSYHKQLIEENIFYSSEGRKNIEMVRASLKRLRERNQEDNPHINAPAVVQQSEASIVRYEAEKTAQNMLLHDIRSPIGRVAGLVQLLKSQLQDLPDELQHIINLVDEQSTKVLELTQFHAIYQQLE